METNSENTKIENVDVKSIDTGSVENENVDVESIDTGSVENEDVDVEGIDTGSVEIEDVDVEGVEFEDTTNGDTVKAETDSAAGENAGAGKKKRKFPKVLLIILIVLASLLIVGAVAVVLAVNHFYNLTNYETTAETVAEEAETTKIELPSEVIETMATLESEKESEIVESLSEVHEETETEEEYDDENYHILLIGVDRRDESWCGNSDAMMLMTINYKEKKVILTSFMRDIGVQIQGLGFRKLNSAYAIGEGPLLLQTYKDNFGLTIDNYAWIDFDDAVAIIDAMGGVDIELSVEESQYLKKYLGYTLEKPSICHLDGLQAMKYARDRTSPGSDYMRTQRQRNVIMAVINKAKNGEFDDFIGMIEGVLPYITHNIDHKTLYTLLARVPTIIGYDFSQQRVPFDDMYHTEGEFLIPDYEQTIQKLKDTLCD